MPAVLQRGLPCTPPDDTPSYKCCHQCTFTHTLVQHTQHSLPTFIIYRKNHLCPVSHGHAKIDLTNKKCLPPAKEKGIKAPGKNSGVTFLSLAGISLYQNRQFFWLRFNARAAPSQDQSQWHLQQAHLYSGGTASAYTDFSIKLSHLFLLFSY